MAQNDNNSSGFALPAPSENAPTALDAPAVTTTSTEAVPPATAEIPADAVPQMGETGNAPG